MAKKNIVVGTIAAALVAGFVTGQAQATVIDGTWSGSASGATVSGLGAPDPMTFSATFSFNDSTTSTSVGISNFTTNFSASSAVFSYIASANELGIAFTAPTGMLETTFLSAATSPVLSNVEWFVLFNGSSYSTESGSFTAASTTTVPEPASLEIFGAGLAMLGVMRHKRKAS